MAGYDNIKDYGFDKLTAEEQREIASKGGKKSGEVRRAKRQMKDILDDIGCTMLPDENSREIIAKMLGVETDDVTFDMATMFGAIQKALKGDIRALEFVRDTRGQNPKNANNINVDIDFPIFEGEDDLEE